MLCDHTAGLSVGREMRVILLKSQSSLLGPRQDGLVEVRGAESPESFGPRAPHSLCDFQDEAVLSTAVERIKWS